MLRSAQVLNIALGFTLASFMEKSGYARLGEPGGSRASSVKSARSALCSLKAREARSVPSPPALRAGDLQKQMRTETPTKNSYAKTELAKAKLGKAKF